MIYHNKTFLFWPGAVLSNRTLVLLRKRDEPKYSDNKRTHIHTTARPTTTIDHVLDFLFLHCNFFFVCNYSWAVLLFWLGWGKSIFKGSFGFSSTKKRHTDTTYFLHFSKQFFAIDIFHLIKNLILQNTSTLNFVRQFYVMLRNRFFLRFYFFRYSFPSKDFIRQHE